MVDNLFCNLTLSKNIYIRTELQSTVYAEFLPSSATSHKTENFMNNNGY